LAFAAVPVIVTVESLDTADVLIGKVALLALAGTVTVFGTEIVDELETSETENPEPDALPRSVIVPVAASPPGTR
jgi:hypothetical protein